MFTHVDILMYMHAHMDIHACLHMWIPWCIGWREDLVPESGGLLMSMVCMAMISGPVKHST